MLDTLNKYHEDGLLYKQVHPTLPLTIWNYSEKVQYENLWNDDLLMCRGLVVQRAVCVIERELAVIQIGSRGCLRCNGRLLEKNVISHSE